jgi:hypothetical protein
MMIEAGKEKSTGCERWVGLDSTRDYTSFKRDSYGRVTPVWRDLNL